MARPRAELIPFLLMAAAFIGLLGTVAFLVDQEAAATAAGNARVTILAESTLSASAAARNAASFAVVLSAEDSTPQVRSEARAHLDEAIDLVKQRIGSLKGAVATDELAMIEPPYDEFVVELNTLDGSLGRDDVEGALRALGGVSRTYISLATAVGGVRDSRSTDALAAGDEVGRAATVVRFLTIFVIPLGVLLVFWRKLRRKSSESLLEAELAHEKELSRSKDRFIADISHELRTPLTGIYGFASAIEESEHSLSEQGSEMLGLIITEAAELSRMVDDLVTAGRLDAGALTYKPERVELDPEVDTVISPFRKQGLSVEYQGAGVTLRADRLRLRQVLRNLISNAIKYGHGEVAVMTYATGGKAVIEVLDNGPGVPPDIEERLFERYVHESGRALLEGSVGLGLAIASSLTHGMGGNLTYDRIDDITAFRITFPLAGQTIEHGPVARPGLVDHRGVGYPHPVDDQADGGERHGDAMVSVRLHGSRS